MSFWNDLLSLLGWEEEQPTKREYPRPDRPYRSMSRSRPSPGDVLSGRVDHVNDKKKFAKVLSGSLTAVVFLSEMADHFIERPSDVLYEGQAVDFVLIKNDPRGWVASISAAALLGINKGDQVKGKIGKLQDRGAILYSDSFQVYLPIAELDWEGFDHPSDVVSLGDEVEAEIIRVELPEGWLTDKRKRRVIGSRRECLPQPESPRIPVAFSSLPFKMWAVTKTPQSCDPVVLYVLEELVAGRSRDDIQSITGLPSLTLDQVHKVLVEEGLAKGWRPCEKGRRLIEAVVRARDFNADPICGLFASASHPTSKFISLEDQREQDEYPRRWPRPPFNTPVEKAFAQATDDALPELLIERIVTEDKRSILAGLQEDDRLRVFLRRDGSLPWKPVYIDTPEHWLLAGLWRVFAPVGKKPYRPANGNSKCRDFLMVQCHAVARKNGKSLGTLFFEPYTATLWRLQDSEGVFMQKLRESSFPPLPSLGKNGIHVTPDGVAKHLIPDSWCVIGVK